MSVRTDKIQSTIRDEISVILQREIEDPHLGFVTVTGVRVSTDLQHATVYVSVMGQPESHTESLRALERASGFIHNQLSRRLRMKRIPALTFREDTSAEYGAHIDELLHQVLDESPQKETD